MGFHSFLQARGVAFESAIAKSWNLKIFKHIRAQVDEASMLLASRTRCLPRCRGNGRDGALLLQDGDRAHCVDQHHLRRHQRLHRADPGQHLHAQDALGQLLVKNPYLEKLLIEKAKNSTPSGTRSLKRAAASSISIS
jgi:ribonucleoside-diphosphate reductase alpha chain